MTERELKRRISDALLKGGLAKDPGLEALLSNDAEARAYADDLQRLDGLLGSWPLPDRGDEAWEALATRIDQRMKDRVTAPGDLTLPPRFDEDDPFVREPSKYSPARPGGAVGGALGGAAAPRPAVIAKPAALVVPSATPASTLPSATPAEPAVFAEPRITTEIAISDLERVTSEPPAAAPTAHASEDVHKAPPPVPAPQHPAEDFSLANLGALEVKHAPPPVPKAPSKPVVHARAPEPKDDRATIPPVRQPLQALAPLPDFAAAPIVVAPLKKSRAPLYGSLAAAATVAVAVGSWFTMTRAAPDAAAPSVVAQSETPPLEQGAPAAPMGLAAMPVAPAAMPAGGGGAPGAPADPADRAGEQALATGTTTAAPTLAPAMPPPPPVTVTASDGMTGGLEEHEQGDAVTRTDDQAAVTHAAHRPRGGVGEPPPAAADTHAAHGPPHAADHTVTEGTGAATPAHHGHAAADTPAASGSTPAREDVVRALGTVHAAVQTCAQGRGGVAWIQVTFSGGTGRVSNALVQGNFAGTPQGSCMARAIRAAQVQPFHSPTFSVAYPFQL